MATPTKQPKIESKAKAEKSEAAIVPANRQTFTGKVVSAKMKDTTVIEIKSYTKHAKYGKFMNRKAKIMAHDPGNTKKEGETATIEACRPISKRKAFKVIA